MISAVIGAQYGDEGKGLVTDFVTSPSTLVVRFNGGAQAGHTVVAPNGLRHVFHHFGAGTLRGGRTLLTRHFLVNPVLFAPEHHQLKAAIGHLAVVLVDSRACVTTPFDMLLNRAAEDARAERHGSCGLGINETVVRCADPAFTLTAATLRAADKLRQRLETIRDEYAPARAAVLGIALPLLVTDPRTIERFLADVDTFNRYSALTDDMLALSVNERLVFEGAQGLRLDEQAPGFPHVTRSRTGLTNVRALLREARRDEDVRALYVTRSYVTRHGAGPLKNEVAGHPTNWQGLETNQTNPYQGPFRYATLDCEDLKAAIALDTGGKSDVQAALVVTCLDQCAADVHHMAEVGLPVKLLAYGPTRDDLRDYHK